MDQLLVNLKLLGWIDHDLTSLGDYCAAVSEATGVPIPDNYPVVGRDAFRTGTGVHAAAIIKARKKGDDVARRPRLLRRPRRACSAGSQVIEVGPMSGHSNVECWLEDRGLEPRPELVEAIFRKAKESDHVLEDAEIFEVVQRLAPSHEPASAGRP